MTVVSVLINGMMQTIGESLAMHEARNDNPHGVTKEQVGLGNVDNTSDVDKPYFYRTTGRTGHKIKQCS